MPSSAGSHPVSARKGRPQLAEHDSDREDREPDEKGVPFDEAAAWAAIVEGYGAEPPDPPGAKPYKPVEDLALPAMEEDAADAGGARGTAARATPGQLHLLRARGRPA